MTNATHLPPIVDTVLKDLKRVVIKVGTRVIDDEKTQFNRPIMKSLTREIAELKARGVEVILVSSGAVGAGLRGLGIPKRPRSIHLRQACAAVGQGRLMHEYQRLFHAHGITTAQVLLTRSDLDRRTSYLNVRETLLHLLTLGVLPIINENDTVSADELNFGDNDFLAALVAGKMDAGLLVLLTRVDGVLRSVDGNQSEGELIEVIEDNYKEALGVVRDKSDPLSMGGMRSKLEAAGKARSKGILVAIANGLRPGILGAILSGRAKATWMLPTRKRLDAWKYYLAFAKQPSSAKIIVDEGAVEAVRDRGKSLLASGVNAITGSFKVKDLVQVFDPEGNEVARGLVNYTSRELRKIQGRSTKEIREILNRQDAQEVIHRNNLVLF